jgi:pimeloyl-ACP methyl ester carboxylesterase
MDEFALHFRNNSIHAFSAGAGGPLIICLHGFGDSSHSFDSLIPEHEDDYTLVALDLPGHGATLWTEPRFTKKDLGDVLELILEKFHRQKAYVLGNSLGARFALCAVETLPDQINKLILLAPDGLKDNFWYKLATASKLSNRIFHYLMTHPDILFKIIKTGKIFGLFSPTVERFFNYNMDTQEKRKEVYHIWTSMMEMNPHLGMVKSLLRNHQIPLVLIYGKYDRVSPVRIGRATFRDQPDCNLIVLDKGHHLLSRETAQLILTAIGLSK